MSHSQFVEGGEFHATSQREICSAAEYIYIPRGALYISILPPPYPKFTLTFVAGTPPLPDYPQSSPMLLSSSSLLFALPSAFAYLPLTLTHRHTLTR